MENKKQIVTFDTVVYTKQQLIDMGFGFDLNGNIISPTEESEHMKEYLKYRDKKKLDKICKWFDDINFEREYLDIYGHFCKEMFINDFIKIFG